PAGHLAAAPDLLRERFGRRLRQPGDDAKASRLRHRRRHLGEPDVMHSSLDDRVLDAEHFGDPGFHGRLVWVAERKKYYISSCELGRHRLFCELVTVSERSLAKSSTQTESRRS